MRTFANILYRLSRFLAGIPPEVSGAMIILALEHPGLVAALFAIFFVTQMVVVKFIAVAIVSILKYVVIGIIVSGVVTWYLQTMFMLHIWPKLPQDLRRDLLKLKDRILFTPSDPDQTDSHDDE